MLIQKPFSFKEDGFCNIQTGRKNFMDIRLAENKDLPKIMEIYAYAREFMKTVGNPTQWAGGYPKIEMLEDDIAKNNLYVGVENGKICGIFAFIVGEDETYKVIENGEWHSNAVYGTIHRIASNGQVKGFSKICFDFCREKNKYLRIDTHKNNKPMQSAVKKYGFKECGTIYTYDGSSRIAFDYIGE